MRLFLTAATSLLILLMVQVGTAKAQSLDEIGFSISPAIIDLSADPGETFEAQIQFENTSTIPIGGVVEPETFIPIDALIDQTRRGEFDASSWIRIDEKDLLFDAGTVKSVPILITVPENANPGSHFALVTLQPGVIQSASTDQPQTKVLPKISASLFITVSGDIVEEASFVSEDLELGRIVRGSDQALTVRIRNTGNTHILPAPRISILKDGQQIDMLASQPQLVLPNTEKEFSVNWNADVGFGEYELRAETVYGSSSKSLVSEAVAFSVTPAIWQLAVVALATPGLLFALIKYRNIPRFVSVLRGNAFLAKKDYKNTSADSAKTPDTKTDSLSEVAKELSKQPSILGLPEEDMLFNDIETKHVPHEPTHTPMAPMPKKHVAQKTASIQDNTHTHIVQTKSSTIVRSVPVVKRQEPKTTTKISVVHHDDDLPKKVIKKAPKKTKKPAKKKTPAKKAPAKAKAKKITIKKT